MNKDLRSKTRFTFQNRLQGIDDEQVMALRANSQPLVEDECLNPFPTDETLSWREAIKLYVCGLVMIPMRGMLFVVTAIVTAVLLRLTVIGCDIDKPLPEWRNRLQGKLLRVFNRLLCISFSINHIEVIGEQDRKNSKILVIGPHSCLADAFVMGWCASFGTPAVGVAKAELKNNPITSAYFGSTQTIFVDRADQNARKRVQETIFERVKPGTRWNRPVAILPEGVCTNRKSVIRFQKGAFEFGLPVQPVVIEYKYKYFDPAWTPASRDGIRIILRTLCQFNQEVTVTFLPVYYPSDAEKNEAVKFANNVQSLIAAHSNLPVSQFSTSDMYLAKHAARHGLDLQEVLPFSLDSFQNHAKQSGAKLASSREVIKEGKTLLSCFASGGKKSSYLNKSQFQIAAQQAAVCLDRTPVEWPCEGDDQVVTFEKFWRIHLKT